VTETTARVLSARRLRVLRDLAAAASTDLTTPAVCETLVRTLVENAADTPFALLYLLDAAGVGARLSGIAGLEAGTPVSPLEVELRGHPLFARDDEPMLASGQDEELSKPDRCHACSLL
jgi:hypothetical protein